MLHRATYPRATTRISLRELRIFCHLCVFPGNSAHERSTHAKFDSVDSVGRGAAAVADQVQPASGFATQTNSASQSRRCPRPPPKRSASGMLLHQTGRSVAPQCHGHLSVTQPLHPPLGQHLREYSSATKAPWGRRRALALRTVTFRHRYYLLTGPPEMGNDPDSRAFRDPV